MSYMGMFYEKEIKQIREIVREEALAVWDEKMCNQTSEEENAESC